MTNNEKLAVIKDLETIRLFLSKDKEKLKDYAVDYIGYDGGLVNREYHTYLPSLHAWLVSYWESEMNEQMLKLTLNSKKVNGRAFRFWYSDTAEEIYTKYVKLKMAKRNKNGNK